MNNLPNFIIAGFPKCGTTSLFYYLNEHPEIFIPHRKEMNYFTQGLMKDLNAGKGDTQGNKTEINTWEKYLKHYKNVDGEKAIGDASPSYVNFPSCFSEIKKELHDPKVIIILRDPIKRAYSNYLHMVRLDRESKDFYEALLAEENRIKNKYSPFWHYKAHSMYYDKVVLAKQTFSNVLVLTQEALSKQPIETLKIVFDFLEVDSNFTPANLEVKYNSGGVYKKNMITSLLLKGNKFKTFLLNNTPVIKKLKPLKDAVIRQYQIKTPKINKSTEDYLIAYFKKDVHKIRELGVDVSSWNQQFFEKLPEKINNAS